MLTFVLAIWLVSWVRLATSSISSLGDAPKVAISTMPEQVMTNTGEDNTGRGKYYDFFAAKKYPPNDSGFVTRQITCTNTSIRLIWQILMKKKSFREDIAHAVEITDCEEVVEALKIDLNGDGRNEILLRGKRVPLCGAGGNCSFWIFARSGNKFRVLLAASGYVDRSDMGEQVEKQRTGGYADIVLKGHFSAAETRVSYYKFNGQKYVEARCLFEVPKYESADKPVWHFITCTEFYRSLNLN